MRPGHSDGHGVADERLSRFQVGTSAYWSGAGMFWLIDARGRVRNGQVVLYATPGSIKMDPAFPYHGLHQERIHALNGITTADIDGDGDLDLLAANFSDNTISVRLNQPLPPRVRITGDSVLCNGGQGRLTDGARAHHRLPVQHGGHHPQHYGNAAGHVWRVGHFQRGHR